MSRPDRLVLRRLQLAEVESPADAEREDDHVDRPEPVGEGQVMPSKYAKPPQRDASKTE